jgi:WbqC-like protein family
MSGCLVAMQPTVLPWAGYFNLMAQADNFIFQDDLQLDKASWQTRNRLIFGGNVVWVSVPIRHVSEKQTILETAVLIDQKWRDRLTKTFSRSYSHHKHSAPARAILDVFLSNSATNLAEHSEHVICFIAEKLQISPTIYRASDLQISGVRSGRLIAYCEYFAAEEYLSPVGSAAYLAKDRFSDRSQATLRFQNYNPQPYPQNNATQFVSHLSIVDVVANIGWDRARQYVMSGSIDI